MDRLEAMRIFMRVAELQCFTAVAHQLGAARSVVTRQVAALEAHLGIQLLARSTRKVTLTPAGSTYLEKCREILQLVAAAESDIAAERETPRGPIRMSLPLTYGLRRIAPLLLDFAQRHPEVELDMDYSDRRVSLIEEGFDLAIRITGRLAATDIARKLGSETMHCFAAPDYLARRGRPRHPSELAQHDCLGYLQRGAQLPWVFEVDGRPATINVRTRMAANNGEVLTEAAARGHGITCQPDFIVAPYLADGRVEAILGRYAIPENGVYAILPSNRHIPPQVRVLLDFLQTNLQTNSPARAKMKKK